MTDYQFRELTRLVELATKKAEEARREAGDKGHTVIILLLALILLTR